MPDGHWDHCGRCVHHAVERSRIHDVEGASSEGGRYEENTAHVVQCHGYEGKDVLKEIAQKDADCVNSKTVLAELASDDSGNLELLGGQNPYKQLAEGAEKVDLSNLSAYDQGCNEEFQKAAKNYFEGNASLDEALDMFKKAVVEKYPEVTAE